MDHWSVGDLEHDTILVVESNVKVVQPLLAKLPHVDEKSWAWSDIMMSMKLSSRDVFLLGNRDHVLINFHCQTKQRTSGKKKSIVETSHAILVPANYKVHNLALLVKATNISGMFVDSQEENLIRCGSTVTALGWPHGTVLRLELW